MSSGTGADITPDEANDLLHKWITESVKVQAALVSGANVTAFVSGLLKTVPDGRLTVVDRNEVGGSGIMFDPSVAVSRKYGDTRAFTATPPELIARGAPRLSSALVFILPDGSQLALFEIA